MFSVRVRAGERGTVGPLASARFEGSTRMLWVRFVFLLMAANLLGCATQSKLRPDSSPRLVVAKWIAAVNAHDPEAIERTLAPDFVWELGASSTQGSAESREAWRLWFEAFPDFRFEVLDTIAEGPYVVTRVRMTGTHRGNLRFRGTQSMERPLAPTGRSFDVPGAAVQEVRNGKIVRLWAYWDTGTLLGQLGLKPGV